MPLSSEDNPHSKLDKTIEGKPQKEIVGDHEDKNLEHKERKEVDSLKTQESAPQEPKTKGARDKPPADREAKKAEDKSALKVEEKAEVAKTDEPEELTVEDLRDEAKKLGIKYRSRMDRRALEDAIRGAKVAKAREGKPRVLRAKGGYILPAEGTSRPVIINGGALVLSDNPAIKGYEHLFEEVEQDDIERVERATANPGERRNVRIDPNKPRGRKAAK